MAWKWDAEWCYLGEGCVGGSLSLDLLLYLIGKAIGIGRSQEAETTG